MLTPEQRTLLNQEIHIWEDICRLEHPDQASNAIAKGVTPLCNHWRGHLEDSLIHGKHNCVGCPIHAHTGQPFCGGTPYLEVVLLADRGDAEWKPKALEQLRFLNALLVQDDRRQRGATQDPRSVISYQDLLGALSAAGEVIRRAEAQRAEIYLELRRRFDSARKARFTTGLWMNPWADKNCHACGGSGLIAHGSALGDDMDCPFCWITSY